MRCHLSKRRTPPRNTFTRYDSFDGIAKPQLVADDQEVEKRDPAGTVQEQPLRRYWVRPLVAITIPAIVTSYYGVIWIHLVQGVDNDEVVKYRTYDGSLVFYSWFVIAVFGLSWSKYGIIGIEASMLRSRFWAAPNLVALLMHSNSTWSSPSGWIKTIIMQRQFYRLWSLLTFLSFLPFIALPLSGLVFEISDGYIRISDAPSVQGRNQTTFNEMYPEGGDLGPAHRAWQLGPALSIPGFGVIYTNESVDRSKHSCFETLPNMLPLDESIPDLFLAPQANNPVSGEAWGLRVKYDCTSVQSASQFTILGENPASVNSISQWNSTTYDVKAYFEIGTSSPTPRPRYDGDHPDYEAEEGNTSQVFEYVSWQYRTDTFGEHSLPFNAAVGRPVEGMGSPIIKSDDNSYIVNSTFFAPRETVIDGVSHRNRRTDASERMDFDRIVNVNNSLLDVAPPIGVRCVVSSGLGTAVLDGVTSTFRDFRRSDPEHNPSWGVYGFGYTAGEMLQGQFYQHYTSSGLSGRQPGNFFPRYLQFINAESLLRSVNLAYAMDAFDLIYGVTSGFKSEWAKPELTSSREGKILSVASLIPGRAVGDFVLALLCLWAALSAGLGLWYGFRRRPADRLDGYTMLRKGADMADELKGNEDFMSGKLFHESGTLAALRGS